MNKLFAVIAALNVKPGDLPEWYLVFADGWSELEKEGRYLVDAKAWQTVSAAISRRGLEIVFDYEHQSLTKDKAPAAGWAKAWRYVPGVGIEARIDWTAAAAEMIAKGEYRYYSPVFYVRKTDQRLAGIHSVALTNTPKTNELKPLLAKLGAQHQQQEEDDMLKKLIASLALGETATEKEVLAEIDNLQHRTPAEVIAALDLKGGEDVSTVVASINAISRPAAGDAVPAEVIAALDLKGGEDVSTVVASIHAIKQAGRGMVSKADFDLLQARIAAKDATEAVGAALAAGKITPDQQPWANKYAESDLDGFRIFVAKAPVVVPMGDLPGKQKETDQLALDSATMAVAKMMDIDAEDIKKFGGVQ